MNSQGRMHLKSCTLGELGSHLRSHSRQQGDVVPLSPLRLVSYEKNPRAEQTDHVLFEIYHGKLLVGYRTLLPDLFYDAEGNAHRFAWLSGNWVRPDYRRQGISTRLLELAESRWEGRLIYTNYAPSSKAVYDHTGRFRLYAKRPGKRFYLRSSMEELLGKRPGSGGVLHTGAVKAFTSVTGKILRMGDLVINILNENRLRKRALLHEQGYIFEEINRPDRELSSRIKNVQGDSLFRRDAEIFQWILEHPWVTDSVTEPVDYHFSYRAKRFRNILMKLTGKDGASPGMIWMVIHNGKLTVPYLFTDHPSFYPCMARIVVTTMVKQGCGYTTIRHPGLLEAFKSYRGWFLSIRNMPQFIFMHKKLAGLLPEGPVIQDGDGDVVFTG